MMAICVLMEATCLYGLIRQSNLAKEGGLKPSEIGAPISCLRVVRDPTISFPLGGWDLVIDV